MSSSADHASTPRDSGTRADVELRLPADGAFASVIRTTAAGLAARLDFTIDDIEDLRIAVGEAAALALPEADPETALIALFTLERGRVEVEVRVEAMDEPALDANSFAWQVLQTMAEDVSAGSEGGQFIVRLAVTSTAALSGSEIS